MNTYSLCKKSSVLNAGLVVFFAAFLPVAALADESCRLLDSSKYLELVQRSDTALNELHKLVSDDLVDAAVTVAPALRPKARRLADAAFRFRDEYLPSEIFGGYMAEQLIPAERTLNADAPHRDRDATQAAYRARRETLALLAALPKGDGLGAAVAAATAAVRKAAQSFIQVSTGFVSNDNCRHDLETARRDEANRRRTLAASGQNYSGCEAPIPFALPADCADLESAAVGSSAICADHDSGGTCSAELPSHPAAAVPAQPNRDLATGGICPNQPAYVAGHAAGRGADPLIVRADSPALGSGGATAQ
jgi:hypothetical protein